ncbi:MAG: ketopantoate reductase [Myxococcota bacterium]|jgi:ketopantoate reductase
MVIIGAGRVGTALANIDESVPVRRGELIPDVSGPMVVCTRNNDLAGVVDATPAHRRSDLVFVQNGMLSTWLTERGLAENTQALLYFAVSAVGEDAVDGGRSVVTGPHAAAFCDLLASGGLACRAIAPAEYRGEMVEKFLWNCIFGLLCQRHAATVGEVVSAHHDEVTALTTELLGVCDRALGGVNLDVAPLVQRLCDYSTSIADYRGAVKEWEWRNGWLVEQERSPLHAAWLTGLSLL